MTEDVQLQTVPCDIHLRCGHHFIVEEVDSWGYIPQGLFAHGYFTGSGPKREQDIIVPTAAVEYISLDLPGGFMIEEPDD